MDGYLIDGSIGMPRGSLLRIDDGAGVLVYVWEGELWLTQEGSNMDHVLQAGQWFRLDCGGAALAHAFQRSVVSLSSPTPEVAARSILLAQGRADTPAVLHRSSESRLRRALRRLFDNLFPPRPAAAH